MAAAAPRTVLIAGASGFIGRRLAQRLAIDGVDVRGGSRRVGRAQVEAPSVSWVYLDLDVPTTIAPALSGCRAAVYLVHSMADGPGYEERERRAAQAFADAAAEQHLERILYLGGVAPKTKPSRHLASRLATGEILRSGKVPVFELRAAMIVGQGSLSWKIVRDLAARLPAMILPRWLTSRSCPIAVDDVTAALAKALTLPIERAGVYDLPGPEALSAEQILFRIAALRNTRPLALKVPVLTPRLSSYWLKLVSGANFEVARELVEGLTQDLLPTARSFWDLIPDHARLSFDEAAKRALSEEVAPKAPPAAAVERVVARISRPAR